MVPLYIVTMYKIMDNQLNFTGIAKNLDSTMLSRKNPDKNSHTAT